MMFFSANLHLKLVAHWKLSLAPHFLMLALDSSMVVMY